MRWRWLFFYPRNGTCSRNTQKVPGYRAVGQEPSVQSVTKVLLSCQSPRNNLLRNSTSNLSPCEISTAFWYLEHLALDRQALLCFKRPWTEVCLIQTISTAEGSSASFRIRTGENTAYSTIKEYSSLKASSIQKWERSVIRSKRIHRQGCISQIVHNCLFIREEWPYYQLRQPIFVGSILENSKTMAISCL